MLKNCIDKTDIRANASVKLRSLDGERINGMNSEADPVILSNPILPNPGKTSTQFEASTKSKIVITKGKNKQRHLIISSNII